MKDAMIDAVEESVFSGVLDNLENEAEYMENINDEEEYANGMRYVIDVLRELTTTAPEGGGLKKPQVDPAR